MLRNSIKPRTVIEVRKCVRRYSTQDWEGVHGFTGDTKLPFTSWRPSSSSSSSATQNSTKATTTSQPETNEIKKVNMTPKKSAVEQSDEEMLTKLEAISGGGGEAGVQTENGKHVGLRRGVKENMFRII